MLSFHRLLTFMNLSLSFLKLQMNHVRNLHRIHVYGSDMPEPCGSFDKLSTDYKLHSRIIENIKSVGYVTPTPIQIQAIPVMLHVSI